MGNAMFYHLTRSPAGALVPVLIDRSLKAGWRVELRASDRDRLMQLDEQLWQGDGFLPHGLAGGPHDGRQPVLLTVAGQPTGGNAALCLVALDGAAVSAEECQHLQRACILFDGNDPAATARARDQWRELTGAGVTAEYWSEEGGGWEKRG